MCLYYKFQCNIAILRIDIPFLIFIFSICVPVWLFFRIIEYIDSIQLHPLFGWFSPKTGRLWWIKKSIDCNVLVCANGQGKYLQIPLRTLRDCTLHRQNVPDFQIYHIFIGCCRCCTSICAPYRCAVRRSVDWQSIILERNACAIAGCFTWWIYYFWIYRSTEHLSCQLDDNQAQIFRCNWIRSI